MKDGPSIARVASLIGDPGRARVEGSQVVAFTAAGERALVERFAP